MITTKLGTLTPHDLPSAPEVALRIVRACGDPGVEIKTLQNLLSTDAALSAELLRIVNAPYFGLRQPVTKMEQVIVVLGQRLLRNMALVFIARETLRAHPIARLDARLYWEDCLRRAVAARLLAEAVGLDKDDAFTLGMLQDMGLLALFTVYPDAASTWPDMRRATPDQRRREEMELFGVTQARVAKMLAQAWRLPDELALPLGHRHDQFLDDFTPHEKQLCQLAACADWMAAVYTATDKRLALARCRHAMAESFNLAHHASGQLLAEIPTAMTQAAAALGVRVSPQAPFEELLDKANRSMIEEHRRGDARHLEQALQERERLTEELQIAFERLAQLAYFDPLTSLVNRRRFDEMFSTEIARHSRSAHSLSVMMVDLDGFKQINDTYGHLLGDSVLQAVAQAMKRSLRISDVAARIGGDEFCVLLPETDVEGGKVAAARLQAAITGLRFAGSLAAVRVGTSIGGSTWNGQFSRQIDLEAIRTAMIDSADKALYYSKNNGRNQVTWTQLK